MKKWQVVLILVLVLAVVLTLVAVAATAFLVLFPAVLLFVIIGGFIARWRSSRIVQPSKTPGSRTTRKQEQIVDAEYVIITDRSNDKKP